GERGADDHVLVSRRKLRESEGLLNAPVDFARHSVQLITQPVIQRQSSARAPIVVGEEVELREAQTDGRIRRAYCQRLKDSRRNAERSQIGATEESRRRPVLADFRKRRLWETRRQTRRSANTHLRTEST